MTRLSKKACLCGVAGAVAGGPTLGIVAGLATGGSGPDPGIMAVLWIPVGVVVGAAVGLLVGSRAFPVRD